MHKSRITANIHTVTPDRAGHSGSFVQPEFQKRLKNIRNTWDKGQLTDRSDFVIWLETLNSSITPHKRTNDNWPCDVEELVAFLQRHSEKIKAIV